MINRKRQDIRIASRMYDMQEAAQQLWGVEYSSKIAPWIEIIESAEKKHDCGVIPAVMHLLKVGGLRLSDGDILALTAAAVDLVEGGTSA